MWHQWQFGRPLFLLTGKGGQARAGSGPAEIVSRVLCVTVVPNTWLTGYWNRAYLCRYDVGTCYLPRARDSQSRQQGIGAVSSVRCEQALNERKDISAMEYIELGGGLVKDAGEGEFFNGASAVLGRGERDAGGRV